MCIAADNTPANRGDANQLATIVSKPGYPQLTHEAPAPATVIPKTAPTMACVVETGMPKKVADSKNSAPDNRAHAIPAVVATMLHYVMDIPNKPVSIGR